jgi:hypothetical protein
MRFSIEYLSRKYVGLLLLRLQIVYEVYLEIENISMRKNGEV